MVLAIKKQSLDKQAAAGIRQQILSGAFPPGFRLVETWLAEQFELSRGTIRGALSELSHEGLVTQVAYTKWVVTEISVDDIWELFVLRSALEGLGARLAAEKITPENREKLTFAYEELVKAATANDRAAVTEADFALHKLIIDLSGHRRLESHYRLIEQQVRLVIASSNALLPTTEQIVGQHEPIVKSIMAGRAADAENFIRYHNLSEGEALTAHVRAALRPPLVAVSEEKDAGPARKSQNKKSSGK